MAAILAISLPQHPLAAFNVLVANKRIIIPQKYLLGLWQMEILPLLTQAAA